MALAVPAGPAACLATRASLMDALPSTGQLVQAPPGTRFTVEDEHGSVPTSVR